MRKLACIAVALVLAGCATAGKENSGGLVGGLVPRYSRSKQLSSAVEMIGKGETGAAKRILASVCDAPPVVGVTDEACFRLALLSLKPVSEREANLQGHNLLRRLKREFPTSPWTVQAQPLADLLAGSDDLRKQNRSLKGQNQALARENEDTKKSIEQMKKSIEQMKHLDLELEKKSR